MNDSDPVGLYSYLLKQLESKGVGFVEFKDDDDVDNFENFGYPSSRSQIPDLFVAFKGIYNGIIVGNSQFTAEKAE